MSSDSRFERYISPTHYQERGYENKQRFIQYWHQLNEVRSLQPQSVLEVGIGSGLVSGLLRRQIPRVVTVDVNPGTRPDIVAECEALPLGDSAFDAVLCCEVLEHVPVARVEAAFRELFRVCAGSVVVTFPDRGLYHSRLLGIPLLGAVARLLARDRLAEALPEGHCHAWEANRVGTPLALISAMIARAGFATTKNFRLPDVRHIRMMVLRKRYEPGPHRAG